MPSITFNEIEHRFGYHRATFPVDYDLSDPKSPPLSDLIGAKDDDGNDATAPRHALVRQAYIELAKALVSITDGSREQSLALTSLQESMMWASAAVAMQSPLIRE